MSAKMKQWVSLTAVGVIAVMAAGWFLLVSPKRGEAATVRAQVASQESANAALQTQLGMLRAQAKTLPAQQAKLALVAAKIPDNPALPALIRALSAAADDAGVELVSIVKGQAAPVEEVSKSGTAKLTPAAGANTSTSSTATKTTVRPLAGTGAGAGSAGVLTSIPLTLNVVGGYFQIEQFFDRLENLTRAAKVISLTMAPGANPVAPPAPAGAATGPSADSGKVLSASISANVYMAVGRGATAPITVPAK